MKLSCKASKRFVKASIKNLKMTTGTWKPSETTSVCSNSTSLSSSRQHFLALSRSKMTLSNRDSKVSRDSKASKDNNSRDNRVITDNPNQARGVQLFKTSRSHSKINSRMANRTVSRAGKVSKDGLVSRDASLNRINSRMAVNRAVSRRVPKRFQRMS